MSMPVLFYDAIVPDYVVTGSANPVMRLAAIAVAAVAAILVLLRRRKK